jgi:hypothetical protein
LNQVAVEAGTLLLTFSALDPVPHGKQHAAGLALRCIVGLTLPAVVKRIGSLKIVDRSVSYSVNLGSGVPLDAIVLQSKTDRAGPIQMRSNENDEEWYVSVTHYVTLEDFQRQLQMQQRVFQQLVPAFEDLKRQPVGL